MVLNKKNKINHFFNQQRELYGNEIFSYPLNEVLIEDIDLSNKNCIPQNLEHYKNSINLCQKCSLGKTRKNFVFGSGDQNADLMLIGDVPGVDEDNQGEPFIGREGKLLDKILYAIGKNRKKGVYLANILKCHIPDNRNPLISEILECESYILKQIECIKPKVILALGRISGKALLKIDLPLKEMRKILYNYNGIPLKVTYHPASILKNPDFKKEVWEDFKWVNTFLSD